jgi:hypothetical protein
MRARYMRRDAAKLRLSTGSVFLGFVAGSGDADVGYWFFVQ